MKRKSNRGGLLLYGVVAVASAGLLLWLFPPTDDSSLWILSAVLTMPIAVVWHEAGHAIAGIANGFQVRMFAVWPILWQRQGSGWRLKFEGRLRAAGFVAAVPLHADDLRRRMLKFVAGGPVASLVAFVLAFGVLKFARPIGMEAYQGIEWIGLWSWLSVLGGVIPMSSRLLVNDAGRLRQLWSDGAESDRICRVLLLSAASRSGVRPRELNAELLAGLPGPDDGSLDWMSAELFRYNVEIDNNRVEPAYAILLGVLERDLAPPIRDVLQLQAVWFEARFRGDLEAAKRRMSEAGKSRRRDDGYQNTLLRAQAAIALLENRLDDAESAARKSLAHCDRIDGAGAVIVIRERTEELLAEIAEARSARALRASS